ncbi:MAG: AMP-binding protein [Anaerolineae bacterium]|nr:AMP-binding protein [Anaerolineae bacterium]
MPTFTEALLEHHRRYPEKTALTLILPNQQDTPVSYRDLVSSALPYARALEQAGIQPGEVVILILQHSRALVDAYWGAILHGAIPAIMPFLTEKLLPERYRADLASLVGITQPEGILTYGEFADEVYAAIGEKSSVRRVLLIEDIQPAADAPGLEALGGLRRQPSDTVLLQHSSGTTGLQKGVALSHQAVFNQLVAMQAALRLSEEDVIVSWLPLYHDMGLIAGYLMPILAGVPLVLMSPFDWVRAPYKLMHVITRYKGTLAWLPNFAYNFCAQKTRDRHLEGVDLSSWRAVINCSEPVRHASHMAFLERFAPYGFRREALAASYAMAENTFAVTQGGIDAPLTLDEIDREDFQTLRLANAPHGGRPTLTMVSNGAPVPGTEAKVVDAQGATLPERHVGEIALRSNCMLTEYYKRPDATREAFRDGWYLTGDYGYIVNGELYVSGRKKDLIIVGGKNVYPQDLETLAMEVPGVHAGRVSAFGVFNEEAGTEDVVIVAEVDEDDEDARQHIADQVRQHVTRNSAIALRHVHLVERHWMVKTSSGKTARLANKDKYLKEMGLG